MKIELPRLTDIRVAEQFMRDCKLLRQLTIRHKRHQTDYEKLDKQNAFCLLGLHPLDDGNLIKSIITKVIAHALSITAITKDERGFCDGVEKWEPCWYIEKCAYGPGEEIYCAMHEASRLLKYGHDAKWDGITIPGKSVEVYQKIALKEMLIFRK